MRFTAKISEKPRPTKTKHYKGLPPELTGGADQRQQMESPHIVVIEEHADGVFLYRFTSDGKCVGDTWHQTVEDAKHQARFEFENLLSDWKQVPEQITNIVAFALGNLK